MIIIVFVIISTVIGMLIIRKIIKEYKTTQDEISSKEINKEF